MENKTQSHHSDQPIFEYNQITDEIFIGTNMCCSSHFEEELLNKGIVADISLEKEKIDAPFGVEFYLWIPIENHIAPTVEQAKLFITTLEKLVEMKKKIYIHCKNGHGRAPTMVAAYFISKGMTVEGALKKIKDSRPTIHLEEEQLKFLENFSK